MYAIIKPKLTVPLGFTGIKDVNSGIPDFIKCPPDL
jgi:hypothetical protein